MMNHKRQLHTSHAGIVAAFLLIPGLDHLQRAQYLYGKTSIQLYEILQILHNLS